MSLAMSVGVGKGRERERIEREFAIAWRCVSGTQLRNHIHHLPCL